MATAKIAIKESLLGTTREPELSTQTKATFDRHARQGGETQEPFMTEEDFVNAVAPESENYVSSTNRSSYLHLTAYKGDLTDSPGTTAQNKKRTIRHTIPDRRSTEKWKDKFTRLGKF